jgi:hypothetical protein
LAQVLKKTCASYPQAKNPHGSKARWLFVGIECMFKIVLSTTEGSLAAWVLQSIGFLFGTGCTGFFLPIARARARIRAGEKKWFG